MSYCGNASDAHLDREVFDSTASDGVHGAWGPWGDIASVDGSADRHVFYAT